MNDASYAQLRVLVTGSRDWADAEVINAALRETWENAGRPPRASVVVVHGECPTGVDAIADRIARSVGLSVETHPADWSKGRRAGPERNAAMVRAGADVCLAFIGPCSSTRCKIAEPHDSHGAAGCAALAQAAGIPTRRFRPAHLEETR